MNTNSPNNKPDDRLNAMLYVLEDPSLDRIAFESRLENDPSLCELVGEMVLLQDRLLSANPALGKQREISHASESTESWGSRAWQVCREWLPVVAAVLLIGLFAWTVSFRNRKSWMDGETESRSIAAAWTDLQSANSGTDDSEGEFMLTDASMRSEEENDVPDWLIFASTVASTTTGQGVIQ